MEGNKTLFLLSTTRKPLPTSLFVFTMVRLTPDGIILIHFGDAVTEIWGEVTYSEERVGANTIETKCRSPLTGHDGVYSLVIIAPDLLFRLLVLVKLNE